MYMIAYREIRPKARALLTVPLAQDSAPGLVSVDLMDLHCSAPDCSCTLNTLFISKLRYERGSHAEPWRSQSAGVRVQVDHRTGEVQSFEGEGPLAGWVAAYLKQDRKWLAKLRKRAADVSEWKDPDAWKSKDWSDLEPGDMVSIHRVRPAEPSLVFEGGPVEYGCGDWYCCNPACDCSEMLLLLFQVDGPVLGTVRIDRLQQRVLEVEKAETVSKSYLHELATRLLRSTPEIFSVFAKRARFMAGEFGAQVMPSRTASKIGRNDPCVCGSGKKYKKCCLN